MSKLLQQNVRFLSKFKFIFNFLKNMILPYCKPHNRLDLGLNLGNIANIPEPMPKSGSMKTHWRMHTAP